MHSIAVIVFINLEEGSVCAIRINRKIQLRQHSQYSVPTCSSGRSYMDANNDLFSIIALRTAHSLGALKLRLRDWHQASYSLPYVS
jgi:hypothetical protein